MKEQFSKMMRSWRRERGGMLVNLGPSQENLPPIGNLRRVGGRVTVAGRDLPGLSQKALTGPFQLKRGEPGGGGKKRKQEQGNLKSHLTSLGRRI